MANRRTVAIVGNPNCGKTTLFNALTGARQKTGNWPGVTVDRKEGVYQHSGDTYQVIDLPGCYALTNDRDALDEQIAAEYITQGSADLIINIVDASNLERGLFLTLQLIEMGAPVVVVVNMIDSAERAGYQIDLKQLEIQLGCPVVSTVAHRGKGIKELKSLIQTCSESPQIATASLQYSEQIETALASMDSDAGSKPASRWQLLEQWCKRDEEEAHNLHAARIEVDGYRYRYAQQVVSTAVSKSQKSSIGFSDAIDRLVLNKYLGLPIFLLVIYLMFLFSINISSAFIDLFDMLSGAIFVDGIGHLLTTIGSPDWLRVLIANGIGGGIQVVATFIPVIGGLYLFLAFLEDSGYMARAAFVMDRFLGKIGLSGRAFVPLIIGFGCNVPAVMATRALGSERERIMTSMMAPFMSCGARLSVYALFAAAFFPVGGQNMVFLLYIIGIIFAILTGLVLQKTVLKGVSDSLMIELPAYHMPTLKNVLLHAWDKLKGFVVRAGKVIIVMVFIINVANSVGTDGSFGHENSSSSVLSAASRVVTPLLSPLGIEEDNWPATVGIFAGVLAKEVVVGTLDAIYSSIDAEQSEAAEEEPFDLLAAIGDAFKTVPGNLVDVMDNLADPLGMRVLDSTGDSDAAAAEQDVTTSTFGAMAKRFDGKVGAFAYLLFVLLYFPCASTIAVLVRETNYNWALFSGAWCTALAFSASTIFYQTATFSRHPLHSGFWILFSAALVFIFVFAMHIRGKRLGRQFIPVRQI
ncbi:MAG: Fe(2+) transporter permease subunit FeoB [Pseudomonadales bacterium]|nr:Fe(2+) transporter permease subunit FeoB [Pseudomonadales bacterium]